jgi:UDP-3-O-[3-hydroxymyristoyl] N-acetylglucosamine deacetylase
MNAATIAKTLEFEGVGIHTGAHGQLLVHPAPPGTGFAFILDGVRVPALAEYANESPLATVIGREGKSVTTIEHVLSALMGMGISDAEIELNGPEVPILDGSAKRFVEAIALAGRTESAAPRPTLVLTEAYELRDRDKAVVLLPADAFRVRFTADFPAPIGTQYFDGVITPELYRDQIAPARTFAMLRDVDAMRARGLARGGSLDNALVFDEQGPMQPLQWPNEVVRHKVLDLIGDFALLGAWPQCEVIAIKSGHAMHTRLARELRNRG